MENEKTAPKHEENSQQLIDLIPALAWSAKRDGSLEYCNKVWLDYTGLSPKQALDWGWTVAIHPEDLSRLTEYWRFILAAGEPGEVEARLRRFDGEYRWFLFRARPQRDDSGTVIQWYGTNTDIEDRKRAEDALRESEQNSRLILDSIPALMCTMTAEGAVETANRPILDYCGKTVEELGDWTLNGVVHEADIAGAISVWRHSIDTGTPYDVEHRIRRADGVYRWFHVRGMPFRDAENRILRWYVLLTDIEDRRRAEEATRASERELRQLVDHVPGYIATANSRGEHDYANQRLIEYTGVSLDKAFGLGSIDTIHPEEQELVKAEWLRCAASGQPMEIHHRLRRFDGTYRWFHVRVEPLFDNQNQITRWYGLLTDIDDQRKAEEALRERERQLQLIVETIPAIVTSRDAHGNLDYVNQRLVNYTGKSSQEIIDSGVNLVHPDDRESLLRVWRDSQETGERYELDYRMRGADGEYRWFQVRGAPLLDPEGRVLRWYAVIADIDDAKRAREAVLKSQAQLARMSQITTVAELSASIAHEVNQPLAAILANANACLAWLSGDPPNLERARGTAEKIMKNANSAAEIVGRVRALFKQAPPAMVLSDMNDTVLGALNLIGSDFREADIAVETELAPDLPLIAADRTQIQQALINLAHNAVEAMEGVADRPRRLLLVTQSDGVNILIQVRDSGCGIANPASIFDPFFTTKENGMGMGLAICRSIVEAHGGRLWATANEEAGTTFSVTLPLHSDVAR
jgi:PAS domain S-box-containing protein